jgi:hypothetical protein
LGFDQLLNNLLNEARLRIQNGQLTESGLARLVEISQPHMHHILMGKRGLQPKIADRLLAALSIEIAELLDARGTAPMSPASMTEPAVLVPMLDGLIGAGYPLPLAMYPPKYLPLPRREVPRDCILQAARLAHDASLEPFFLRDDLVVIASQPLPPTIRSEMPELPQVLELGGNWCVRRPGDESILGECFTRAEHADEDGSLVGVVVLTIRRMRPLRLPLRLGGNSE